jgi:hypothetical protein
MTDQDEARSTGLTALQWNGTLNSSASQPLITTLLLPSNQRNACKDGLFEAAGRANLNPSTQGGTTDG